MLTNINIQLAINAYIALDSFARRQFNTLAGEYAMQILYYYE